ncbi:MAG: phage tail tape measure protein [Candidatus Delongbacteria bacterium]
MMTGFTSAITISVFGTSNLSAFTAASKRLDKFAGSFEQASERVKKAGLKTMLVGAGIAASLAMPILQMGTFQTEVARVGGIAEASAKQVQAIGDTAMYLGAKTAFTAQQVAEGQGELASMGLTADQVSSKTGIMADTISFATGQQVAMADAGALLVGTLNAYQKPLSQATTLGDMLTVSMNRSNLKFADLQESMLNTASTSATFGQSIETNLAVLGVLANRNEVGARAGTRLSMTMTKLYTQAGKVNKVLGVNVYDQATGKTRDFIEVFGELKAKLSTLSEEKKNTTLTDIFGAEGIKVFNILLSSSREELMGMRGDIAGAGSAMADFEKRIMDTPTGQWKLMKAAMSGVSMTIGAALMPMTLQFMGAIKGVADAIFGWLRAHPALTKVAAGIAFVSAVGLLLGGALLLVGGGFLHLGALALQLPAKLGQIAFSMGVTNSAAVPLTASLKALGAGALKMIAPFALVGLALYAIVKAWDTNFLGFRDTVEEVWFAIKPVVYAIWGGVKATGQGIATVFDATLGAFWRFLTGWYQGAMSGISPILYFAGMVAWGLGFMVGTILRAWNWIQANPIVSGLLFVALGAFAWPLIAPAIAAVWTFATQTMLAGGRAAIGGVRAAAGFLMARVAAMRTGAAYLWNARSAILLNAQIVAVAVVSKIWAGIQWLLNAALSANPIGIVVGLLALLTAGIVYAYQHSEGFRNLLNTLWDGFLWGVKTAAKVIFWPITGLKLLYDNVKPVRDFMDGMWDGFLSGIGWVIDGINAFIQTVNKIPGIEIPMIPKVGAAASAPKPATSAAVRPVAPVLAGPTGLEAAMAGAPRGGRLAAAARGGMAAAQPTQLKPAQASVGTQPAKAITNRSQTAHIDRSITVSKIEVTAGPNTPATSVRDQVLEALRSAAGQEDGLEGLQYAN